jgi:hypothetical protein
MLPKLFSMVFVVNLVKLLIYKKSSIYFSRNILKSD